MLDCYKKMYGILCSAASEAIELLQDPQNGVWAAALLQKALYEAEDLYLSETDTAEEDGGV